MGRQTVLDCRAVKHSDFVSFPLVLLHSELWQMSSPERLDKSIRLLSTYQIGKLYRHSSQIITYFPIQMGRQNDLAE
jgi:hypothetical protein